MEQELKLDQVHSMAMLLFYSWIVRETCNSLLINFSKSSLTNESLNWSITYPDTNTFYYNYFA